VFACFFIVGATGMWAFEGHSGGNGNFDSFHEALWSATVHVLSGLEDKEPLTLGGRAFSILVLLASIGLFGTVAGRFATVFMKTMEIKMPRDVAEHIAICNWNSRGDGVIKELHSALAEPSTEIVVVADAELNEELLREDPAYERVFFVRGDATLGNTLRAARVHLAKSVVILADEESPDADAKSTLVALAISRLCKKEKTQNPHIVAEALNHRKMEHLEEAGVNEVVCAADYGLGVVAQCALHAELSKVYENLLKYSENTNEIYIVEGGLMPSTVIGKSFEEASRILIDTRNDSNPAILLGIRRGKKIILNPRKDGKREVDREFKEIQKDDALIVLAFHRPDLCEVK
jgi:voltage-gated potassium channel